MNIGVIGAGMIGATVGRLWLQAGHSVRFGLRRASARVAVDGATSGTISEATAFGDVVFTAAPYGAWPDLARLIDDAVAGKVVIDAANPYPQRDGAFAQRTIDAGEGAALPIARLIPNARFARAFTTVYYELLKSEAHRAGEPLGIPLAADDATALALTERLIRDAGFEPVPTGGLATARTFDPGTPVYNTGWSAARVREELGL